MLFYSCTVHLADGRPAVESLRRCRECSQRRSPVQLLSAMPAATSSASMGFDKADAPQPSSLRASAKASLAGSEGERGDKHDAFGREE